MKVCVVNCFLKSKRKQLIRIGVTLMLLVVTVALYAQDGDQGLIEANTKVRKYFDNGTKLMYAIGAIVGLIGAIKV